MLTQRIFAAIICLVYSVGAFARKTKHYDLVKLLNKNGFVTDTGNHATALEKKDTSGRDVFLRSSLGIAFHAADTGNYDVIYFRPFRFHSTDRPTRRNNARDGAISLWDDELPGDFANLQITR